MDKIKLNNLPKLVKRTLLAFTLALTIGYVFGFSILYETTQLSTKGIVENYNGNEDDENAEKMLFKKSGYEIRTSIHTHILTLSVVFLIVAALLYFTELNENIKSVLMIEPYISLVLTFGGIYFLWMDILWFKYIIVISGAAMHVCFASSLLILIYYLGIKKNNG